MDRKHPIAKEAFMAGYKAGYDKGVKKLLQMIYDMGPEARTAFTVMALKVEDDEALRAEMRRQMFLDVQMGEIENAGGGATGI